jgi:hypothetical protein
MKRSAAHPVWLHPNIQFDPINSLGRETPATVVLGNAIKYSCKSSPEIPAPFGAGIRTKAYS